MNLTACCLWLGPDIEKFLDCHSVGHNDRPKTSIKYRLMIDISVSFAITTDMKRTHLMIGALALMLIVNLSSLLWVHFSTFDLDEEALTETLDITDYAARLQHLDEVLTMSALMGAQTGDFTWEDRYKTHVPLMDETIAKASIAVPRVRQTINQIDDANQQLIKLETSAFDLVRAGKLEEAQLILNGQTYRNFKAIYTSGIELIVSEVDDHNRLIFQKLETRKQESLIFILVAYASTIGMGLLMIRVVRLPAATAKAVGKPLSTSKKDQLTNVFNRRHAVNMIAAEIDRHDSFETPFSVIALDLDNFHLINDALGHDGGDRLLIQIAQLLETNSRKSDIVCRWSEEEFIIICPNTTDEGAMRLAENLRERIRDNDFNTGRVITASFGVCAFRHDFTANSLVQNAESALTRAKNSGRNRTVAWSKMKS